MISIEKWNPIRDDHHDSEQWFEGWKDELISQGYDGLIVPGGKETLGRFQVENPTVYAVFNPTQIKSIHNRGTLRGKN